MAAAQQILHGSELDALFPSPSPPPTVLSPSRYPGSSPDTAAALRHLMKDNHIKHHMFNNDIQWHNHFNYHALGLYALGASGSVIEQYYKQYNAKQRPVIEPPEAITKENFVEHLGVEKFYVAYRTFFIKVIEEKGVSATLNEYIFSEKYNFEEGRDASSQPKMLARFIGGLTHPLIHVGYAMEFGIPGMAAEGLAMASVHWSERHTFFPPSLFKHASSSTSAVEEATTKLSSLFLNAKISIAPSQLEQPQRNHAFSILAKIMQHSEFAMNKQYYDYNRLLSKHGASIWRYAEQWTIDLSQPGEIEHKMEECIWVNTILYATCRWGKNKDFIADFFFMHLVTSSLFLPSVLSNLPQNSQVMLLRSYFASTLAWWITRGFPQPDIQGFLDATSSLSSDGKVANPFLNLIQSTILDADDHMLKIQRAFAHFSSLYGTRPKGYFKDTELEGAEALDGSLFFTAARLTDEYIIRDAKVWDREGASELD
ncbi:hypothetical protein DEU56DRAFT_740645 [Suillus clintonianus]|uniref:uncharacterized protein n=1 Tax=Suillus clintonianus TaxID=1904413 RepID=UPI001B863250|nr:uncharacterized protein DEU56DRAFT_740645 [Suillus clintonianus]KAG2130381.1 hypothetical protein DEU56DRAFT_740645 [Suillus clintonianus]